VTLRYSRPGVLRKETHVRSWTLHLRLRASAVSASKLAAGLDREAAKQAFGQFLAGGRASADPVEFVNLIVDYLTEHGVMEGARLYESPFTDLSPRGPEGVFSSAQVDQLVAVLAEIRERAAA
jgi:type I site-specific restriction endonuclease